MILLMDDNVNKLFENNSDIEEKRKNYDGWTDYNLDTYFIINRIKQTYSLFNEKFFSSVLPEIEFKIEPHPKDPSYLGFTRYKYSLNDPNDSFDNYEKLDYIPENSGKSLVKYISICPHRWNSRAHMEEVLLHEMCHVYQTQIFLCGDFNKCYLARKQNYGHEKFFVRAMNMVNNSPKNSEGFIVEVFAKPSDYYSD